MQIEGVKKEAKRACVSMIGILKCASRGCAQAVVGFKRVIRLRSKGGGFSLYLVILLMRKTRPG